jgi:hypothetical protein
MWKEEKARGRVDEDGSTTLPSETRSNAMPLQANPPIHVMQNKKETRGAIGRSNIETSILHLKSPWERGQRPPALPVSFNLITKVGRAAEVAVCLAQGA